MRPGGCQRLSLAMYLIPMSISNVRSSVGRVLPICVLFCLGVVPSFSVAQTDKASAASEKQAADKAAHLTSLPAAASAERTCHANNSIRWKSAEVHRYCGFVSCT